MVRACLEGYANMKKLFAARRRTMLPMPAMGILLIANPAQASNESDMAFYYDYVVSYTKSAIKTIEYAETLQTTEGQCASLHEADGQISEANRFAIKLKNVDNYYNSPNYDLYNRVLADLNKINGELGVMVSQCRERGL